MNSVLFVCLGNICRSPLAEAVARSQFARSGLAVEVASAGTGDYHVGEGADSRAIASAAAHGYDLSGHRARQVAMADFDRFDMLLAMDQANYRALRLRCPVRYASRVALFLPYAGIRQPSEVPDPYFGGKEGFERVIELARRGVDGLIARRTDDA